MKGLLKISMCTAYSQGWVIDCRFAIESILPMPRQVAIINESRDVNNQLTVYVDLLHVLVGIVAKASAALDIAGRRAGYRSDSPRVTDSP